MPKTPIDYLEIQRTLYASVYVLWQVLDRARNIGAMTPDMAELLERIEKPLPGDLVLEVTRWDIPPEMQYRRMGRLIGTVIGVHEKKTWQIELFNGELCSWDDCHFIRAIENPRGKAMEEDTLRQDWVDNAKSRHYIVHNERDKINAVTRFLTGKQRIQAHQIAIGARLGIHDVQAALLHLDAEARLESLWLAYHACCEAPVLSQKSMDLFVFPLECPECQSEVLCSDQLTYDRMVTLRHEPDNTRSPTAD